MERITKKKAIEIIGTAGGSTFGIVWYHLVCKQFSEKDTTD